MSKLMRGLGLLSLLSVLAPGAVSAAECESPPRRDPLALRESAQQDEMLAGAMDRVGQACSPGGTGESCAKARAACTELSRTAAERQSRHEEGIFLADLQRSLNGQRYAFTDPGAVPAHGLAPCEGAADALAAAADARRQSSAHHQRVASEYEAYLKWAGGVIESCKDQVRLAAASAESAKHIEAERIQRERLAREAAAAEAARQAQAAEAARQLAAKLEAEKKAEEEKKKIAAMIAQRNEEDRQRKLAEEKKRAEEEKARLEAEKAQKAKKDREAALEAQRKEEERRKEAAEDARRAEKEKQERLERERVEAQEKQRKEAQEKAERLEKERLEREEQAKEQAARETAALKEQQEQQARKAEEDKRRDAEARASAEREARKDQAKKAEEALRAQEEARRKAAAEEAKGREAAEAARKEKIRKDLEAAKTAEAARLEAQRQALLTDEQRRAEEKEARRRAEDEKDALEKRRREEALAKAADEHEQKIAQLEHSASANEQQTSDEMRLAANAAAQAEEERRIAAEKQIAAVQFNDPNARSSGALQVQGAGGIAAVEGVTAPNAYSAVAGLMANLRKGFWFEPPLEGLQKGVELRATGRFLADVSGGTSLKLLHVSPELRVWLGMLAIGAAGDYRRVDSPALTDEVIGVGPSLALALVDDHATRLIFSARWLPFVSNSWTLGSADIEFAHEWFTMSLEAGLLTPGGYYASASMGFRLRF